MGWNTGYTIFEATVIGAYNLGKLDKDLLAVLMEPYRGTDIDSGGKEFLLSTDGKEVEQIVIETWGLEMPAKPNNEAEQVEYDSKIYDLFNKVTYHFGW